MTIGTKLFTWLRGGKSVGTDAYGNRYYRTKNPRDPRRERRWVMYEGVAEASKVPPQWHGWLHHTTDVLPSASDPVQSWQKPHEPNLTGTAGAYRPPGHTFKGGQRARATGDYEPWRPS
jgi:NADH:ubiquinone oxidoreductase subunit